MLFDGDTCSCRWDGQHFEMAAGSEYEKAEWMSVLTARLQQQPCDADSALRAARAIPLTNPDHSPSRARWFAPKGHQDDRHAGDLPGMILISSMAFTCSMCPPELILGSHSGYFGWRDW